MQQIVTFGILLIILGVFVTIAGVLLSILAEQGRGKTDFKGKAIIFIGPIPIVRGIERDSTIAVAVLAIALMIAAYLFYNR